MRWPQIGNQLKDSCFRRGLASATALRGANYRNTRSSTAAISILATPSVLARRRSDTIGSLLTRQGCWRIGWGWTLGRDVGGAGFMPTSSLSADVYNESFATHRTENTRSPLPVSELKSADFPEPHRHAQTSRRRRPLHATGCPP
jgi:hypothetical protein